MVSSEVLSSVIFVWLVLWASKGLFVINLAEGDFLDAVVSINVVTSSNFSVDSETSSFIGSPASSVEDCACCYFAIGFTVCEKPTGGAICLTIMFTVLSVGDCCLSDRSLIVVSGANRVPVLSGSSVNRGSVGLELGLVGSHPKLVDTDINGFVPPIKE